MNHCFSTWCISALLIACGVWEGSSAIAQQGTPKPANGMQVLVRGPVHEAFAEVVAYNPKPGVVISKQPPAAIEEQPPDRKPVGDHVVWIPGYWAWDDEQQDFLWVSGVWRNTPPGRQWVPGYWARQTQGFQWIAGYWAAADSTDVQYLPEPPQSLEAGPNAEPASEDDMWVPGTWGWNNGHFVWNPGYWCAAEPGWVWVPACYVWTPRGCVFTGGYWDYPIGQRGVLFAPIRFTEPVYARSDFVFSPAIAIATDLLTDYLFCRPSYCHYYFGDYFADRYGNRGIYPWFAFAQSRMGYDPLFAYERQVRRHSDPKWAGHIESNFRKHQQDADSRPPHTLHEMQQRAVGGTASSRNTALAIPVSELATSPDSPVRLQPVDKQERQQLVKVSREIQKLGDSRQNIETERNALEPGATAKVTKPSTAKLPQSPLGVQPGGIAEQTEKTRKAPPDVRPTPRAKHPPKLQIEPPTKRMPELLEPRDKPRTEPSGKAQSEPTAEPRPRPRTELPPSGGPRPSGKGDRPKDRGR